MAEDRIEMQINVDAGDAVRQVGEVSRSIEKLAEKTKDASEKGRESWSIWERVSGGFSSFGERVAKAAGYIATAVAILRELADVAMKAAKAVVDAGHLLAGLSSNIGGKAAIEVFREASRLAGEEGIGLKGRAALVESAETLADLRPGATQKEMAAFMGQMADLQRATGQGGRSAASAVLSLEGNLGMSREQAVTATAALVGGGLPVDVIESLASRSGPAGLDFLAAAFAAREQGLPLSTAGRSLGSLMDAVNRQDERGGVSADLRALGITEGMSTTERIAALAAALESGVPSSRVEAAIGGPSNMRLLIPFARAIKSGGLARARKELADPRTIPKMIAEQEQNDYVAAMRRQERRELAEQVERENSSLGGVGERMLQAQSEMTNVPIPNVGAGLLGFGLKDLATAGYAAGSAAVDWANGLSNDAVNKQRITFNITNNNGVQIYGDDPPTAPSGRLDQ